MKIIRERKFEGANYGTFKGEVADCVVNTLMPIQQRYNELINSKELDDYITMMEESRDEALTRAIDHAKELGANAIVAIRFDSNEISNVMQEILVYGTAVVVEKE